jgi:hypothetical protein
VKRVNIRYDGADYSIGGRDIDDVQAEIDAGLAGGETAWLTVNSGEGRFQSARLLIAPGVHVTLIGIEEPPPEELSPGGGSGD